MKDLKPVLAGLYVAVVFGFSFLFTKEVLSVLTPFHLLGFRFATAALVLTILKLFGIINLNFKGKKIGILLLLAFFQPVTYFIFETIGIKLTTASEAGMMIALIPVAATSLSALFLDEKPDKMQLGFILTSVSGVVFIIVMKSGLQFSDQLLGIFLLLGAVLSAGFYNILSRKSSLQFKPLEITYIMMWIGAVVFNSISLFRHWQTGELARYFNPLLKLKVLVPVLYLSILSSVLAFFMVNFMLSKLKAYQASVFTNLSTVISVTAGVTIRNEPLYWFHLVGGLLILIGVWGTNYYENYQQRREKSEFSQ